MTMVHKLLGRSKPAAATPTSVYSPAVGVSTIVSSIIVCNVSAVTDKFRIYNVPAAGAENVNNAIYYDIEVQPGDSFLANVTTVIQPQGFISVEATGGNLTFTLSGLDVP